MFDENINSENGLITNEVSEQQLKTINGGIIAVLIGMLASQK